MYPHHISFIISVYFSNDDSCVNVLIIIFLSLRLLSLTTSFSKKNEIMIMLKLSETFEKWLFDLFYNKNGNSKSTNDSCIESVEDTNDWKLWCKITQGCHKIVNTRSSQYKFPVRDFVEPHLDEPWQGFYIGDNKYVNIDQKFVSMISVRLMLKLLRAMLRELKKNGIDPYNAINIIKSN